MAVPALAIAFPFEETDWFGVGVVLAIVGAFLLTAAVGFRDPQSLLAQRFGRETRRLATIRETMFQRLQVQVGCLLILLGLVLLLVGHLNPPVEPGPRTFPMQWVGGILVGVVVLELGGWWVSHALFRRRLRAYFRAHPEDLGADPGLMREVGELFGLDAATDDTVQAYLGRLRRTLELPERARDLPVHAPQSDVFEPEPEEEPV